MSTGRRPSGLCGAAILIAARIHNFKRTTQQIVEVVNVCDETIKKRLEEFSNTEVAKLTKSEFDKFDIYSENGRDPPSFLKSNKKITIDDELAAQIGEKAKEIDDIICDRKDIRIISKIKNEIEEDKNREIIITDKIESIRNPNKFIKTEIKIEDSKDNTKDNLESTYKSTKLTKLEDDNLSEIDEKETNYFLLSNEEYRLKKMLWEVLNKDWIEDQRNKVKKETKKRKRKIAEKPEVVVAKTPLEAIKNSKFSKKMNHSVLTKLFEEKLIK